MLDLSEVTDGDVLAELDAALLRNRTTESEKLLRAVRKCAERFSFANTRTYPRPDHPDPDRRRSFLFLFCGVLVSLRTTLENEQLAMTHLMERARDDSELLSLSKSEIRDLIRVSGMADTKAERIYKGLRILSDIEGGVADLSKLSISEARSFFLSIPGIGPKAADCLLTIGLGMPSMVVDVNVFRAASWILDGKVLGLDYSDSKAVNILKNRLDILLKEEDAFIFQIVHTELLLLSKSMKRGEHQTERCLGSEWCTACKLAVSNDGRSTLF